MTLLTPSELRHTLKISRSTEHRLLKSGMPSIGAGKLRRYEEQAAVDWFRTYAEQDRAPDTLPVGEYECRRCRFKGIIEKPTRPGPCPQCGSMGLPQRITTPEATSDNSRLYR